MKSFQQTQLAFTQHLRAPLTHPLPLGLDDNRMGIYRDLVYNNIARFIAGTFPILKSIVSNDDWQAMVRDFLAHHSSQSPYFLAISEEFLTYLNHERESLVSDPPFLVELAHYEWVELALDIAEQEIPTLVNTGRSLLDGRPRLSPLAWWLAYQFPVHKIGPDYLPTQASAAGVFLLVYRTRCHNVKFMEINAMTYKLLELLQSDRELTGRAALLILAQQVNTIVKEEFLLVGATLLEKLLAAEIIIGVE